MLTSSENFIDKIRMISPSTRSIYKISVAAISFILLFASCARELEDEAGKVSSVRLGIDYWDRSSRSFLALRRLFREDTDWKKGINTELIIAVPEDVPFDADPNNLEEIIDSSLVDLSTSSVDLTIPLDTPIKLYAYRYVEILSLSIAQSGDIYYDSFGETNTFSVGSKTSQTSVTIFLSTNGTPSINIVDTSGSAIQEGKTSESTIANSFKFAVHLDKKPKSDVVLPIQSSDTSEGSVSPTSLTFSRTNWDAPQTVTVSGVSHENDSKLDSTDQNYSVSLGPAISEDLDYSEMEQSLSMINVDSTNGTFEISDTSNYLITSEVSGDNKRDNFTIKLLVQPTSNVILPLSSSDTTEGLVVGSSSNQQLLTFTSSNWTETKTVYVEGVDDDVDENLVEGGPNKEYELLFGKVQSEDERFKDLQIDSIKAVNLDDDTAKLLVTVLTDRKDNDTADDSSLPKLDPLTSILVNEGVDKETFSVQLQTEPTDNVTVRLQRVVNSTLLNNFKFSGQSLLPNQQAWIQDSNSSDNISLDLIFTPSNWNIPRNITITALDDDITEGGENNSEFPETYQYEEFILSNTITKDPSYQGLRRAVKIFAGDNDQRGIRVVASDKTNVGSFSYKISLNSRPIGPVTLNLSLGGSGSLSLVTLTFTPDNWKVEQTVTITPSTLGTNNIIYGDHSFTLGVTINENSSGSGYDELVSSPVFITDNRIISITDTQIPLIDNVSITRSEEWLGIGEEYEIRLFASEPLEIQDPNSVSLILKTGPSSSDNLTLESSLESSLVNGVSRANTVMVFKNTVKPGDNITVPEITTFSGSILDTASNPLNADNLSNMSFSASPNLDGVKPQEISVSIEDGVAAYKGQGLFYGGVTSNDNVTLTLSAMDQDNGSGVSGFYIVLDNTSFETLNGSESGWYHLSSSDNGSLSNHQVSFDLGLGDDNKTVFVAFKDNANPPNIASTYDEISIAPRLISSHPDNASTTPSQTALTLNFNKKLDNNTVSSAVSLVPEYLNKRLYVPGLSYSDNSSLIIRFNKALPDNGSSFSVTVLDNLTDSDGINALDNLSFSFATVDLQTKLAGYYAFDGYSSPTLGTDNLSLSSANLQYTTGLFNDSHGAVQFTNANNNFSLAGDYSISFWVKGSSGDAFGYSPSSEWKHVVVKSNNETYVNTESVPFQLQTILATSLVYLMN